MTFSIGRRLSSSSLAGALPCVYYICGRAQFVSTTGYVALVCTGQSLRGFSRTGSKARRYFGVQPGSSGSVMPAAVRPLAPPRSHALAALPRTKRVVLGWTGCVLLPGLAGLVRRLTLQFSIAVPGNIVPSRRLYNLEFTTATFLFSVISPNAAQLDGNCSRTK